MSFKYLTEVTEKPPALIKPIIFLVEGQDDGIFLEQILDERSEDADQIQILFVKGISKLWSYLEALVKSPNFVEGGITRICVIVDADVSFSDTEAKAQNHFRKAGLAAPNSAKCSEKDGIRVGLYVFPNSRDNGELEDLIIGTLSDEAKIIDAQALLAKHEPVPEGFKKPSKRVVQISLALSNTDLCAGIGRGIRNGAFPVSIENFGGLSDFISDFLKT